MSDNVDTAAVRRKMVVADLGEARTWGEILCDEVDRLRGERVQVGWRLLMDDGSHTLTDDLDAELQDGDEPVYVYRPTEGPDLADLFVPHSCLVCGSTEHWGGDCPTEGPGTCPTCGSDDPKVRRNERVRRVTVTMVEYQDCTDPWHSENRETP